MKEVFIFLLLPLVQFIRRCQNSRQFVFDHKKIISSRGEKKKTTFAEFWTSWISFSGRDFLYSTKWVRVLIQVVQMHETPIMIIPTVWAESNLNAYLVICLIRWSLWYYSNWNRLFTVFNFFYSRKIKSYLSLFIPILLSYWHKFIILSFKKNPI